MAGDGRKAAGAESIGSPWLTVDEAADYARVGRKMVLRWIASGGLAPAVTRDKDDLKAPGNPGYLIERCDLDTYLRSLKRKVVEKERSAADLADLADLAEPPRRKPAKAPALPLADRLKAEGI